MSDELYGGEILVTYDNGKYVATKALTNDGKPKTQLKISPDGQKLGYFLDLNYFIDKEKNKEINFIDYDNYTALVITNKDGSDKKEIYRGDYHTSYWEWLDADEVVVYYNCGTECMIGFVIDANMGTKKAELLYGVGYQWSPDKKYVVAYHYVAVYYGITIGNKFGNETFTYKRTLPEIYSELTDKTEARFSPDSKKLALILKKENEKRLELLVFDLEKNLKIIYQRDLEDIAFANFHWIDNQKIIYQIGQEIKEVLIE
ncbi:hypothetical protein KKG29_03095 [Patescibacteria group bacterium]|nr:hypothetical protein [Patescibacteria group bacterium]MBU4000133.1 hypothetical protein [Patescibacteria group bacterium]MBU4056614.1 hypothetical protein [Patescibacteria group bacterium]MBU4368641.1 hypothetical protein [Patescibacteria group bacterium]